MPAPLRSLLLVAAVGLLPACSAAGDPAATPLATLSPSVAAVPTCQDYPMDAATALLADPATGQPRVPGAVSKAVSAQSNVPGPEGSTVHVIAMDVEGKTYALVHPVTDGSSEPTGDGPYASVTSNTAVATGFPEDREVEALGGEAIAVAVGCLTSP